jgi:hypothetical protein
MAKNGALGPKCPFSAFLAIKFTKRVKESTFCLQWLTPWKGYHFFLWRSTRNHWICGFSPFIARDCQESSFLKERLFGLKAKKKDGGDEVKHSKNS